MFDKYLWGVEHVIKTDTRLYTRLFVLFSVNTRMISGSWKYFGTSALAQFHRLSKRYDNFNRLHSHVSTYSLQLLICKTFKFLESNHTTGRKPGPLKVIQYSLFLGLHGGRRKTSNFASLSGMHTHFGRFQEKCSWDVLREVRVLKS